MRHQIPEKKLIVANCSGFYGDRFSAAREMVENGPIDVLTGDYLAELTMAILLKDVLKKPGSGFARTFLKQMEEVMGQCLDKKIRVVTNAGGLNPRGLAEKLEDLARHLGLHPEIAYITGDDLMGSLAELEAKGETFTHLDKNISLQEAKATPITANAYLGGFGIAAALEKGSDIVICGRVADAALVAGPAAWYFNWKKTDWDRLAGAYAAGHIIECGTQATGGNYSFMDEIPSYTNIGFPIAEMFEDGSFTISKHHGTGGRVSTGTVTAQLLYEVSGPRYLTPDVVVRLDTIQLEQTGPDRVYVSSIKGEPAPETMKVCINTPGDYKNTMTLILTGLDIEKKAKTIEKTLFKSLGGKERFQTANVQLIRSEKEDPPTNDEAFAFLRITVMDPDADKVAQFSTRLIEMVLASIPGLTPTAPPSKGSQVIVHWPCLLSTRHIQQTVTLGKEKITIESSRAGEKNYFVVNPGKPHFPAMPTGALVRAPLGRAFATRSGDKGGNANLGVWGKTPEAYVFLKDFLTTKKLRELLPECALFPIERYELPNLLAVNFYIRGILGDGVAASIRSDPQAKTLGEYLRARIIEMPETIIINAGGTT